MDKDFLLKKIDYYEMRIKRLSSKDNISQDEAITIARYTQLVEELTTEYLS